MQQFASSLINASLIGSLGDIGSVPVCGLQVHDNVIWAEEGE